MFSQEDGSRVVIQCNNPNIANMMQFWTEVQEWMDKGYRYDKELLQKLSDIPTAMSFARVTLIKVEPSVEPVKEEVKVVEPAPAKVTKKATKK